MSADHHLRPKFKHYSQADLMNKVVKDEPVLQIHGD